MPDSGRQRILVVDDSRFDRELTRAALGGSAEVECVGDAGAALEALERRPADLVISDLHLPGLSGLELLARLRRDHPGTDCILVTGEASVESAVEALRMGAADYLRKPLQALELSLAVERTLSRRRLLSENVRLRDVLSTVEACRVLAPCLEPGEVYPAALDVLLRALFRERGLACFQHGPLHRPDGLCVRGFDEAEAGRLREALARHKVLERTRLVRPEIVDRGPLHDALHEAGLGAGRWLVVPLPGEESEGGYLWILEGERAFGEGDLEHATIVAGHARAALRNAERYTKAKERAFVDDVTEVYNARYLLEATTREIRRAERYGSELTVLFLDLDRFKLVNDRFGHLVGSDTLRRFSQILGQCVRQVDTLARYGGDEFTILLVDTDAAGGLRVAERIRQTVETTTFETSGSATLRLTVSVGVATYPYDGRTREALLEASDQAMYRAKSRGRNRVCAASELAADRS
jgi:diguanylate cyclase (GGDEF)-like protein